MLCVSQCRRIFPLRPKPRYSRHARARGLPPDLRLLLLAQLYVLVQLVGLAVKSGRGLLVVVNDISEASVAVEKMEDEAELRSCTEIY